MQLIKFELMFLSFFVLQMRKSVNKEVILVLSECFIIVNWYLCIMVE